MFYKKEEIEHWQTANIVNLPNGQVLTSENRENDYGWIWYDEEPIEYTEWYNEMFGDDNSDLPL